MQIGLLQFDVSHDFRKNLLAAETAFASRNCRLLILPELSMNGYLFADRAALCRAAQPVPDGPAVQRMMELTGCSGKAILFGLAEKDGDRIYNTAVLVQDGRFIGRYRKIHLSDFEKRFFDAGSDNPVFDLGNCRIGIQICFDLWFPEISREQLKQGADLFCAPCSFGGETSWSIARIRAIENQMPLILCNRIGQEISGDMNAEFLGRSTCFGEDGSVLYKAPDHQLACSAFAVSPASGKGNVICRNFQEEIRRHY